MQVRTAVESDRPILATLAAALQARPDRHISYLGLEPATIAAEMVAEDEDWTAVSAVALGTTGPDRGAVLGWLMGSVDAEIGRVWWFGPFVDADEPAWTALADALYAHAHALLAGIEQEELAPDARFERLVAWARRHGAVPETGSAVLTLDRELEPPTVATRPIGPGDVATVGALHEELFPGTHTTGDGLVHSADADHVRLVLEHDGELIGYVAAERQPDGGGYLDFLGVAAAARRQGWGAELVRAGVAALRGLGCHRVSLTVRAGNEPARALYRDLGFTEERVILPLRIGFSLG